MNTTPSYQAGQDATRQTMAGTVQIEDALRLAVSLSARLKVDLAVVKRVFNLP